MFGLHYRLERKAIRFTLVIILVASIGGLVEIAPLFTVHQTVEDAPDMRVYTPLELAGRNIRLWRRCIIIGQRSFAIASPRFKWSKKPRQSSLRCTTHSSYKSQSGGCAFSSRMYSRPVGTSGERTRATDKKWEE